MATYASGFFPDLTWGVEVDSFSPFKIKGKQIKSMKELRLMCNFGQ
jgi:hypothetical protein